MRHGDAERVGRGVVRATAATALVASVLVLASALSTGGVTSRDALRPELASPQSRGADAERPRAPGDGDEVRHDARSSVIETITHGEPIDVIPPAHEAADSDFILEADRPARLRAGSTVPQAPPPLLGPMRVPVVVAASAGGLAIGGAEASVARDAGARGAITLYGTDWCSYSREARQWLRAEGVTFTEHDVDLDPTARARLRAINPRGSVPTFDVDGQVLVGFSPGALARLLDHATHP